MRIAYLILAHHQPAQLYRLINSLTFNGNHIYVHVDARSDLHNFLFIQDQFQEVIFISQREACYWGQFSLVQATLNLINAAGENFDYYILLSAQDYPLKDNSYINEFLQANDGKSFINYKPLPCKEVNEREDGAYRFNRLHTFNGNLSHKVFPPYSKKKLFNGIFNRWAKWYSKHRRQIPNNMQVYWGHQWWVLHKDAIIETNRMISDKKIINFFKNTWVPDEMFFQTILLNSRDEIQNTLINDNYRFTSWDKGGDDSFHPSVLTESDFSTLNTSHCLFARKFTEEESTMLITKIDEELLHIVPER